VNARQVLFSSRERWSEYVAWSVRPQESGHQALPPRSSLGNLRLAELNSHALALKRQEGHRRSTSTSVGSDCVSNPKAAEILRQHPSQAYSESSTLLSERTAISRAGWNLSACLAGSAGSLWNRDRGCCVQPPIRLSKAPSQSEKKKDAHSSDDFS